MSYNLGRTKVISRNWHEAQLHFDSFDGLSHIYPKAVLPQRMKMLKNQQKLKVREIYISLNPWGILSRKEIWKIIGVDFAALLFHQRIFPPKRERSFLKQIWFLCDGAKILLRKVIFCHVCNVNWLWWNYSCGQQNMGNLRRGNILWDNLRCFVFAFGIKGKTFKGGVGWWCITYTWGGKKGMLWSNCVERHWDLKYHHSMSSGNVLVRYKHDFIIRMSA